MSSAVTQRPDFFTAADLRSCSATKASSQSTLLHPNLKLRCCTKLNLLIYLFHSSAIVYFGCSLTSHTCCFGCETTCSLKGQSCSYKAIQCKRTLVFVLHLKCTSMPHTSSPSWLNLQTTQIDSSMTTYQYKECAQYMTLNLRRRCCDLAGGLAFWCL